MPIYINNIYGGMDVKHLHPVLIVYRTVATQTSSETYAMRSLTCWASDQFNVLTRSCCSVTISLSAMFRRMRPSVAG